MVKIQSFRDLTVWEKSIELTICIYALCKKVPKEEQYGLVSQMQRAAVSIPSNIAEGCQRNNRAEFRHFCAIAYGSSAELETQLLITQRLYDVHDEKIKNLLDQVLRMLRKLISQLASAKN